MNKQATKHLKEVQDHAYNAWWNCFINDNDNYRITNKQAYGNAAKDLDKAIKILEGLKRFCIDVKYAD